MKMNMSQLSTFVNEYISIVTSYGHFVGDI